MYSSITNKKQRYTIIFIIINDLHVSGGSSAHHQEPKLHTQHRVFVELLLLLTEAVRSSKTRQIPDAVYIVLSS